MKKLTGFTLVEILVALFILAIVAVLMTAGLRASVMTQQKIVTKLQRLAAIQSAVLIVERDIMQIMDRPILLANGRRLPSVMISTTNNQSELEFTRAGFINPLGLQNRSTLQRVGYALKGGALIRTSWQSLDRTDNTRSDAIVLLLNVKNFSVRYLDTRQQMISSNLTQSATLPLPLAIEINIEGDDFGRITRFINLPH